MKQLLTIPLYPCEKIREMFYDALEGSLAPVVSLRFKLHLRTCPPCREYLRLYKMAADMRSFRRDNPPPTDLMDKTLAFLERQGIAAPDPEGDGGKGEPGTPPKA